MIARENERHAHCDRCRQSFAIDELSEFAILDALTERRRILDDECVEQLRRAGTIVDYVGPFAP